MSKACETSEKTAMCAVLKLDEEKVKEYKAAGVKNPVTCTVPNDREDQYIIKRVIAFPGERVVVKNGVMTVYQWDNDKNDWNDGTVYDKEWRISENDGPKEHTSGDIDMVVPEGELFVSGDNREGNHSWDSRNGLGTIPYCRIVGPVIMRLFPFDKMRGF